MKVVVMFIFALALIAFVLWHPAQKAQIPAETQRTTSLPAPLNPKLQRIDTSKPPAGFVGPSGPPHVVGPSGPPPSY